MAVVEFAEPDLNGVAPNPGDSAFPKGTRMSTNPVQRRMEILAQLGTAQAGGTRRLCEVCRDATGATGAGIMLMSETTPHGSICTTNEVSELIEQLQYDLGEGPCID